MRMHFWLLVAREYARFSRPVNTSLNCTMPAFANISVGSFGGTRGPLATTSCPRERKKSRKARRSSADVFGMIPLRSSTGRAVVASGAVSNVTAAYLEARDLGRVEQQIALRGKVAIAPGVKVPALLCRTTSGVFVVGARNSEQGVAIDLAERDDVKYEPRRLGDKLSIGEAELVIPPRASNDARLA